MGAEAGGAGEPGIGGQDQWTNKGRDVRDGDCRMRAMDVNGSEGTTAYCIRAAGREPGHATRTV
jgi:hypothetical protein